MNRQFLLLALLFSLCLYPIIGMAQDSDGLGGYAPPPLFGDPKFPKPENKQRDLKLPPLSKKIEIPEKEKEDGMLIRGRVFEEVDEEPVTTAPEEVIEPPAKIERKPVVLRVPPKPDSKPTPPLKSESAKAEPVDSPKDSEGVVKGPKTMPAHKKQDVETETTFEGSDKPALNILGRVHEEAEKKAIEEKKPADSSTPAPLVVPLPDVKLLPDGTKKVVMLYMADKSELGVSQKAVLDRLILPELEKKPGLRLSIQAYASPSSEGAVASDRRTSLSRAMTVRRYLLEQKVMSNRIDVRALGAQTNAQPLDRVELYLAN